jgi:hypothetical protein
MKVEAITFFSDIVFLRESQSKSVGEHISAVEHNKQLV